MVRTDDIIEILEDLREDEGVSRLLQERIDEMMYVLGEDIDIELRIDRVRSILDDLEDARNVPMHIRTQLWNVSASLEML